LAVQIKVAQASCLLPRPMRGSPLGFTQRTGAPDTGWKPVLHWRGSEVAQAVFHPNRSRHYDHDLAVLSASSFAFAIVASTSAGAASVGSMTMLVTSVTPTNPNTPPSVLVCRS
jgi:hypothetical protein